MGGAYVQRVNLQSYYGICTKRNFSWMRLIDGSSAHVQGKNSWQCRENSIIKNSKIPEIRCELWRVVIDGSSAYANNKIFCIGCSLLFGCKRLQRLLL